VTEDQTPSTGPDELERRAYAALVDSLAGTLDLRGGLAEAVDVAGYTAMSSHIALNLEAGLETALAAHHRTVRPLEIDDTATTTDLLQHLCDRDPRAWDEIVHRYRGVVVAKVRSFRLQDADALDAVQMTWLRLAENCDRIQRPEQLAGWLATTASRECLRILRQQAQHTTAPPFAAVKRVPDPCVGPEQHAIDADTARLLWSLIATLSPRRQILLRELFVDNPRPYAALSRAAGIPSGGIGPTRARALRQLRLKLDEVFTAADGS
jgi:RNA polymerase sigma factor (sigma-70 family)